VVIALLSERLIRSLYLVLRTILHDKQRRTTNKEEQTQHPFTKDKMMFRRKYTSEEIVAGLLAHDIEIYRHVDAVYRPKVIRHVRRNSGSREDGKDLYMHILYRVYAHIEHGKYDSARGDIEGYFMMLVRSAWLDKLKQRKRRVSTQPIEPDREFTNSDPAEQAEQDLYYRRVQALRHCIARLSKDEQEIIQLFYFAKESLESIAQKMGITYDYARRKISLIRRKIREMLRDDPDGDLQFV